MKGPRDLTKSLSGYKTGWVAVNTKGKVVSHAKTFKEISEEVKKTKEDISLLPASDNYFGFIT
ncbi:MAG: hypothetical protein HY427_03605 [Candidatus Levybacteria bacterium]|nr:hypothetical protein [Candidatus Levybacteria bacterium]